VRREILVRKRIAGRHFYVQEIVLRCLVAIIAARRERAYALLKAASS
jgi:hypothetical protein